jgi:hypothetical protein
MEKNSMKSRSFCFGTRAFSGVGVEMTAVGPSAAAVGDAGGGVAAGFSRAVTQEARNRTTSRNP